jgi:N-methylhydantoinase B
LIYGEVAVLREQYLEVPSLNGVELALFSGRLNAICEEMGFVLQRAALSPNIKDRLDFSCAIFDQKGRICAQAAHIPVHLGSMAYAMTDLVNGFIWEAGDVLVLNDPYSGGTHLPDVTLISPIFINDICLGFVANRAHHANIGARTPGSMPLSQSLDDEGVIIKPQLLFKAGRLQRTCATLLMSIKTGGCNEGFHESANVSVEIADDYSDHIPGDFLAQVSANKIGLARIGDWLSTKQCAHTYFQSACTSLNQYGISLAMQFLQNLPSKKVKFVEYMDGDGFGATRVPLSLSLSVSSKGIYFDFSETSGEVKGNLNCPISVTAASVFYVFICLLPDYVPSCHGVFSLLNILAPEGSILNARPGAAVAAGNVETSMRVVDLVQGAFSALGIAMPAASQGTMNNVAMGAVAAPGRAAWDYYETLGGGMGAGELGPGLSATQCHMTNTLNTPVESLEMHYPLLIDEYAVRRGSGGEGLHCGGNGLVRSYQFQQSCELTLLTERRSFAPWGMRAESGKTGINKLNGGDIGAKVHINVNKGDVLRIETPGGGAWSRDPAG